MLTRQAPSSLLAQLEGDLNNLMSPWRNRSSSFLPSVAARTEGEDLLISVDLPGVDVEKDVEVTVGEGRLKISGERKSEVNDENSLFSETRYGFFSREFVVPHSVTADSIEASYDRGLLSVRVKNVTTPPREPVKISISSGNSEQITAGAPERNSTE